MRAAGVDGVGDVAQGGGERVVADDVVDLLAAPLAVEHSGLAKPAQVPRHHGEVDGQAAGDLGDRGSPAAHGQPGEEGQAIGVAEGPEEAGGQNLLQRLAATCGEGRFGGWRSGRAGR